MKIGNLEVYGIIYKITNLINDKIYIGQTTLTFKKRYDGGKWWNKTHNIHLKSSVDKYGLSNFEVNEIFDVAFSKEELDIKECSYIDLFKSNNRKFGYNNKTGGSHGKHSEKSKIKMSRVHSGVKLSEQTKQNMSKARKGKRLGEDNPMFGKNPLSYMSEESYNELMKRKSENIQGENNPMFGMFGELNPFYGKEHTQETKDIISKKAKERLSDRKNNPNCKEIDMYDNNKNYIMTFDSVASGSEWLFNNNIIKSTGTGKDAISKCLKFNKEYKGFLFTLAKLNQAI